MAQKMADRICSVCLEQFSEPPLLPHLLPQVPGEDREEERRDHVSPMLQDACNPSRRSAVLFDGLRRLS